MQKADTDPTDNPYLSLGQQSYNYAVDRMQRQILFWDILRKRGNNYLSHLKDGQPAILLFDYEIVLDGSTFEKPVNYSLLRIKGSRDQQTDVQEDGRGVTDGLSSGSRLHTRNGKIIGGDGLPARPIVIIDPRAGHGPGIGGSKLSSQVGIALEYGHPVYFVSFTTDPEPGQTIDHVHHAEIRFLEEVARRHQNAPKAAVIGNCQAGWAAALIGADRQDVTGPLVFNGSPLSYWGGAEGSNPMRYKGGLSGGIWLTSLCSDLGNDKFDGANIIAGFEDLNPANTLWTKYYHLFTSVDTEEKRFLDFDKWWGGFFKLNSREIHFIVSSLFIGNELENGLLKLGDGHLIDLKNSDSPILAFASEGDNITPPPQALNWIHKVYGSVEEIKRCGQVIIYMVHDRVGHLGIFVSGSVARKEHNQILGSMGWLDYIGPGLYEMVIEESDEGTGEDSYNVRFEQRQMEDILNLDDGQEDEVPFYAVNTISRINDAFYQSYISPWVRWSINEPAAEWIRQMHPLRVQRYMISDTNPFCRPVEWLAEAIRPHRKPLEQDNFFEQIEELFSDSLKASLDYFGATRDFYQEMMFKTMYDSPFAQAVFGEPENSQHGVITKEDENARDDLKREIAPPDAEEGGYVEACVRVMSAVAGAGGAIDLREFQMAETIVHQSSRLRQVTPAEYQKLIREQTKILHEIPRKALTSLDKLLPSVEDRKKVFAIAEKMAHADDIVSKKEELLLKLLKKVLFTHEVDHDR